MWYGCGVWVCVGVWRNKAIGVASLSRDEHPRSEVLKLFTQLRR